MERHCRATSILPHLSPTRRAMLRSQSGPVAGIPFSTTPTSCLTRLEPALFRVLQRRLSLPLLLTNPSTRRLWPPPCSLPTVRSAGGLFIGKRSCSSVQRGRGGSAATNLRVRDMGLECQMPTTTDVWRLWQTVCHSLVACSLLWTPLQCLQFRAMATAERAGWCGTQMGPQEERNNIPRTRATR